MKAIKFKEANKILAENQPEYIPLPVMHDKKQGVVVSCYKLTIKERLRLLFKGKLWVGIMTFNQPLQPQFLTTKKQDIIGKE